MKCVRLRVVAVIVSANLAFAQDATPAAGAPPETPRAPASRMQDEKRPAGVDAAWRESAQRRIEQHRKANFEILVEDVQGGPIPDATVTVTMQRHRFGFGALIGTSRWEDRPNADDARRHLDLAAERFNKVVTIIKANERSSDAALDWLVERGIRVRGHYLMWAPLQPERGRGGQPAEAFGVPVKELIARADERQRNEIRNAAFTHLERLLVFAGKRVTEWDAINHIANDSHVRYSDLFGTRIYADVLHRARELAPHAQFWVNEGNVLTGGQRLQKYHDIIAELIALGSKPDGIGFMSHFREGDFTHPQEIYRRLDRFAALVPNLQLTELDIDTSDEQLQADYMRDVLTIAFSHPAVSGIVMWQVWGEGAGTKTLWRKDWSIRPAGQVWLDQVFQEWWTDEMGTTDPQGEFRTRGFLGEYVIAVQVGHRTKVVRHELLPTSGVIRIVF